MAQHRAKRKLIERLRQLHSTGLCYVHHERKFIEVSPPWWLWHVAYGQLATPYKLDGQLIRVAPLTDRYTLTFTERGPAILDTITAAPGPSIPSNYWQTLQQLLLWNPTGRYTTLAEIRRAISEEAWRPQQRVVEVRRGVMA